MNIKRILGILVLILTLLFVTSCGTTQDGSGSGNGGGSGTGDNTKPDDGKDDGGSGADLVSVTLLPGKGATVKSENPVKVEKGGTATFEIELENRYTVREIDGATFDRATSTVTAKNVTGNTRVTLTPVDLGYDTIVNGAPLRYNYYFKNFVASQGDASSHNNGIKLYAGEIITVTSRNEGKVFLGWSLGDELKSGGKLLSTEREYTFELSPDMQIHGNCTIFANYADLRENSINIGLNGGEVYPLASNLQNNKYYTVSIGNDMVEFTMSATYFQKVGTFSLIWDDGSFYRDGYVLKEFNTKPDGSGESFDPGSLYPMKSRGPLLYCIWAKDSEHSDFEYEDVTYGYATGVTAATAPHWQREGIKITNYKGDDREVVIPETIDGKYVTAIAAGAFQNKKMESLVLSRYLLNVADGAFVNCSSLETIYYPDSIYVISDAAFDTASWKNVKNFYVRATMAPRLMTGQSDCAVYAIKLARMLANPNSKRAVIISGSSSFQGLSGEYLELLLGKEWTAVNFGTTRTTHIYLFLPVVGYYANENDVIIYAPENSIYEMGEPEFYWKTLRDIEGMYNVFRHLDISKYTRVLTSFSDFNRGTNDSVNRYTRAATQYERMADVAGNEYGEYDHKDRHQYMQSNLYKDYYDIRLDKWFVGKDDKGSNAVVDLADITTDPYRSVMNDVIERAKINGAKVFYSFAPMADEAINEAAREGGINWYIAFEQMIKENFVFDGVLGDAENYIFNVKYFYNNAFHPNDYGRVFRTYRVYIDMCEEILEIPKEERTDYYCGQTLNSDKRLVDKDGNILCDGSMFEEDSDGTPLFPAFEE